MTLNQFLFGPYSILLQPFDNLVLYIALACVAITIIIAGLQFGRSFTPPALRIIRRLRAFFLTTAILALLWVFFRYENAYYLSWRFWMLTLAAVDLVWLAKIALDYFRNYKTELAAWQKQQIREKYIR